MKTRLAVLAVSLLVVSGLSGCYTEFATTSGNYGDYGSSYNSSATAQDSSQYGYSPTYYDSTGALAVNPNYGYNDYGYGSYGMGGYGYGNAWPPYGYGYGYYGSPYMYQPLWTYSMFSPSAAWWPMDTWYLGFGLNTWYGGPFSYGGLAGWGNYPSYYYPYMAGYYPNSPYYNVYSPYSPYSLYPWYTPYMSGTPTPRVRNSGDTRYGRAGYGGDVIPPNALTGQANTGTANASTGVSGNVREGTVTRTRVGSTGEPAATGVRGTSSAPRTRERAPVYMPTQQNATPNPQHRVRERAPSYTPLPQRNPSQAPSSPQSNPQQRVREQAPRNTPPQQNSTPNSQPQSNPQQRVRENAPSYTHPPQRQNPAPSYNPPPQNNPPQNNTPPPPPPPRIRHGYVSYNNGEVRPQSSYRQVRVIQATRQRAEYSMPAQQVARYEAPRFQQSAPRYEYRAASQPVMRTASAPARSSQGASGGSGGRARH